MQISSLKNYKLDYFISLKWDFLYFIFPIILSFMIFGQFDFEMHLLREQSLINFFIIKVLFDASHVMATYFYFSNVKETRVKLNQRLWQIPFFVLIVSYSFFFYSPKSFESLLGYMALWHIVMQQYGWFRSALQKGQLVGFEKLNYQLGFLLSVVLPVLYWHTGSSVVPLSYFYPRNLKIFLPSSFGEMLISIHFVLILIALVVASFYTLKNKILRLGVVLSIFTTWVMFYVGLVLIKSNTFFWIVLIVTHGWCYHLHILRKSSSQGELDFTEYRDRLLSWLGIIMVLTFCWYYLIDNLRMIPWIVPLLWAPLTVHYGFDALVWKRYFERSQSHV